MTLLRSQRAPAPRTLVDIFRETVDRHPDAPALDNGADVLTYAEFAEAADELAAALTRLGVGPGDRVGVRISSGTTDLYVAIMGVLLAGAAYVPVDADDPDERARMVFGGGGRRGRDRQRPDDHHRRTGPARRPSASTRPPGRRRVGHLHLRFDRHAEGGRRVTPLGRGRLRRRGGAAVPRSDRRSDRRPGDGRALGRLRRLLRGDVAGLAVRRLPGARPALTGPQRHGSRALADRQRHHRRLDGAHAGGALADGGACARSGCSSSAARRARRNSAPGWPRPAARCGTPTGRPRRPWWPVERG